MAVVALHVAKKKKLLVHDGENMKHMCSYTILHIPPEDIVNDTTANLPKRPSLKWIPFQFLTKESFCGEDYC